MKILLTQANIPNAEGDIMSLKALESLHKHIQGKLPMKIPIDIPEEVIGKDNYFFIVNSVIEDKKLFIYVDEKR